MMEFTFERSAWQLVLDGLRPGTELPAGRFLALMEQESEEDMEQALSVLEEKEILLDISRLPGDFGAGALAQRLEKEKQLVEAGELPEGLEENDALRLYLQELAQMPACGDVELLAQAYLNGDTAAPEKLTALLLHKVVEMSFTHAGRGVLLLDLIQEGSLGLWQGIMRYEGGNIEEHCSRYIARTLAKTVTLQARANGVGRKLEKAMEDYRSADKRLLIQLGRNPTLEEIAQDLGLSLEEASAVEETLEAARLLERTKAQAQPKPQEEEEQQAVEDTAYFQMRQRIAQLLDSLEETDARVLTLRFGLEGGTPLSPEETGGKLGLSANEVVAREAAALSKLRTQEHKK